MSFSLLSYSFCWQDAFLTRSSRVRTGRLAVASDGNRYTTDIAFPATPAEAQADESSLYYIEQIKTLKEYEMTTIYVDFSHLLEREEVLARAIQGQYYRCVVARLASFQMRDELTSFLLSLLVPQIPSLPPKSSHKPHSKVRTDLPLPIARLVRLGLLLLDRPAHARVFARVPQPVHHRGHPGPPNGQDRSVDEYQRDGYADE